METYDTLNICNMCNDGYMNKKIETHFETIFTLYSSEAIALDSSLSLFIHIKRLLRVC